MPNSLAEVANMMLIINAIDNNSRPSILGFSIHSLLGILMIQLRHFLQLVFNPLLVCYYLFLLLISYSILLVVYLLFHLSIYSPRL